ncbi:hypothetical protein G6F56_001422 [Rhizopus delemar]|nr:hypothetical protein G6F56_001422 [Rhizopus delemar]
MFCSKENNRKRSFSPLLPLELDSLNEPNAKKKKVDHSTKEVLFTSLINTPHRFTSQRNVSAFLRKLFIMINDPTTDIHIHWSSDGKSFLIENHEQFSKNVLPRFYKHNTFTSFVRQLNMYDFHKIPHDDILIDTSAEIWRFNHPYFQKSREDLLSLVTRKKSRDAGDKDQDQVNLKNLLKDVTSIKKYQNNINADLSSLRQKSNKILQETFVAREKHKKHELVIKKLLQLLTLIFSGEHLAIKSEQVIEEKQEDQGKAKDLLILDKAVKHSRSFRPDDPLFCHSKSAFVISKDIDALEHNVEILAGQLGVDSSHIGEDFVEFNSHQDYSSIIDSVTRDDKTQLFRMVNTLQEPRFQETISSSSVWSFEQDIKKTYSFEGIPSDSLLCGFKKSPEAPPLPEAPFSEAPFSEAPFSEASFLEAFLPEPPLPEPPLPEPPLPELPLSYPLFQPDLIALQSYAHTSTAITASATTTLLSTAYYNRQNTQFSFT